MMARWGLAVVVLLTVLFYPWFDSYVLSGLFWWRQGERIQALVIMADTWDEVEKVRILRDAPPPPEIPDHTHELSECPTC